MKKIGLISAIVLLLVSVRFYGQEFPDLKFSLLNNQNGVPVKDVRSVFKDSRGLIWMGTNSNGLYRYDGRQLKVYNNSINPHVGFPSDYVSSIQEDKNGWLWIETLNGLIHFNPLTEKQFTYQHKDNDKFSIGNDYKPLPYTDSKGRLWITSTNGLQLFDSLKNNFIPFYPPPINKPLWQFQFNHLGKVLEDSKGRLWVTSAYGLYLIDVQHFKLIPFYTGVYSSVTDIFEDSEHQIWVAFWGTGLKKFDPETGRFSNAYTPESIITTVNEFEDISGNKWICFLESLNSLVLLNKKDGTTKKYKHDAKNNASIHGFEISAIFKDNENRLWICTEAGINLIDMALQNFTTISLYRDLHTDNPNEFSVPRVISIENDNYRISSWYKPGYFLFDKDWKFIRYVKPSNDNEYMHSSTFTTVGIEDNRHNFWYGTEKGIKKKSGNAVKQFLPQDYCPEKQNDCNVTRLQKRSDGNFLVEFSLRGIYLFDTDRELFTKKYLLQNKDLYMATSDNSGNGWAISHNELYMYNQKLDSFILVPLNYTGKKNEGEEIITYRFDNYNSCWILYKNFIVKFNVTTNQTSRIKIPNEFTSQRLEKFIIDSANKIWLMTSVGLLMYNEQDQSFQMYSPYNGLPDNLSNFGAFKQIDNQIFVSSTGSITFFNPYEMRRNVRIPSVKIIDIEIQNIPVTPDILSNGRKQMQVNPGIDNINIHFAVFNYTASQQNRLYYRINSATDTSWIESADGDIRLFNLQNGKYILKVKGCNNEGLMNETGDELIIIIKPFWYQTVLFKIFIFLIIALTGYYLIRRRIKMIRKEASFKQKITETEMAALKAQMNPHFMFNCINSIDAFIHSNDKYNATLYLNKFAKLLRNILDSSKQNTVSFNKDITTLQLYVELEELRHENKFKTVFTIDEELLNSDYKVPPLIIQPFVENAILHGLKNRIDDNGILTIDIKKLGEQIVYSLMDNGIGRKAAGLISQNKESSYGMQMSYERIRLFNQEKVAAVNITDLYESGKAAGTLIKVHLKII